MLIGLNQARTLLLRFPYSGSNTLLLIFIWVKIALPPNELNISVCYSLYATYRTRSNDPLSNICIAICNTNTKGRHPLKKVANFRALPELANPPPPPNSGNLVLFFPDVKTAFYAYDRRKVLMMIMIIAMIIVIVMMIILMIMMKK